MQHVRVHPWPTQVIWPKASVWLDSDNHGEKSLDRCGVAPCARLQQRLDDNDLLRLRLCFIACILEHKCEVQRTCLISAPFSVQQVYSSCSANFVQTLRSAL